MTVTVPPALINALLDSDAMRRKATGGGKCNAVSMLMRQATTHMLCEEAVLMKVSLQ